MTIYRASQFRPDIHGYPDGRFCTIYVIPGHFPDAPALDESTSLGGNVFGERPETVCTRIIAYLENHESATVAQLSKALDLSGTHVQAELRRHPAFFDNIKIVKTCHWSLRDREMSEVELAQQVMFAKQVKARV